MPEKVVQLSVPSSNYPKAAWQIPLVLWSGSREAARLEWRDTISPPIKERSRSRVSSTTVPQLPLRWETLSRRRLLRWVYLFMSPCWYPQLMSKNTLTNILIPSSTTYQASSGDTWATSPSLNLSNSNEKVWTLRWQPAAVREYTEESFMAQMTKERFDYFREYCWSALPYTSTCLCLPWQQQDIRQGQVGLDRQEKFVCCAWVTSLCVVSGYCVDHWDDGLCSFVWMTGRIV